MHLATKIFDACENINSVWFPKFMRRKVRFAGIESKNLVLGDKNSFPTLRFAGAVSYLAGAVAAEIQLKTFGLIGNTKTASTIETKLLLHEPFNRHGEFFLQGFHLFSVPVLFDLLALGGEELQHWCSEHMHACSSKCSFQNFHQRSQ